MFKFVKDFLFEENEVAAPAPVATASVTALDEKVDPEEGIEQPVGSMGMSPLKTEEKNDHPFWQEPPKENSSDEAEKSSPPLVLDIHPNGESEVKDSSDSDPLAGSVINLDTTAPSVDEVAEAVEENKPPVMDMTKKDDVPEPAAETKDAPSNGNKNEDDLQQIQQLLEKTQAEISEEEKTIAEFEKDAEAIAQKLEERRSHLENLRQTPVELEKAKAELEILIKNQKEVEDRLASIRERLAQDSSPAESSNHHMSS